MPLGSALKISSFCILCLQTESLITAEPPHWGEKIFTLIGRTKKAIVQQDPLPLICDRSKQFPLTGLAVGACFPRRLVRVPKNRVPPFRF